jgi:hypothetical protein
VNGVRRGLIYSVSFLLVTGFVPASVANAADPNLVGCWRFNGNTLDSSGNELHGTLHGDPQFVTGVYDKAMEFDGDDYVTIDGYRGILGTHARSITAWIKTASSETQEILFWGTDAAPQKMEFRVHSDRLRLGHGSGNAQGNTVVTDGEWHHVAVTLPENAVIDDVRFYLDGQDDTSPRSDPDGYNTVADWDVAIGCRSSRPDRYFIGSIDDVLIYDKVLTQQELKLLMRADPHLAWDPNPPDQVTVGIDSPKQLTWSPGDEAHMHDVYFGTDPEAVTNANVALPLGVYRGRQNLSRYPAVGNLDLEFGQTYFWRVDEVSDAHPDGQWKGEVWSFEVEAYLLVDDFDSYADTNDLLHTWVDGNDNGAGSIISLETEFVGNSMKCVYDNTSYPWYSEAGHTYSTPQDWTVGGAKALELQFRGDVNNIAEPMYVALEDAAGNSAVVTHDDPNALVQERWAGWQIWAVALQDFVDANGVSLANIKKVTIGIGNGVDPFPLTSTGTVYFDDIRLYPPRCLPEYVATSFNNDCITVAD